MLSDVSYQAVRSGVGVIGIQALIMVISVLRPLVLARLLGPDIFGLVAVSVFVVTAAQVLTDPGFTFALIQKRTVLDLEYDALWTISILRGIVLGSMIALFCTEVGRIFRDPRIVGATLALALIPVISGFLNTHYSVRLQRELSLGRVALGQLLLVTSDLFVSSTIALITRSFWSLVVGLIVSNGVVLAYSFAAVQNRPSLSFRWGVLRPLLGYGKYILAGTVLYFVFNQFDNAVVARMMDVTQLGYYKMAYGLSFFALGGLTAINNTLIFPTLSRLHHKEEHGASAFVQVFRISTAGYCLLMVVFASAPHEMVAVLFGPSWLPASAALPVLAIAAVFRAAMELIVPYFAASGRPQRTVYALMMQFLPFAVLIVALTERYGFVGTSWAVLVSYAIGFCAEVFLLEHDRTGQTGAGRKIINILVLDFLLAVVAVVFGSALCSIIISSKGPIIHLVAITSASTLAYGLLIYFADREVVRDLKHILLSMKRDRTN